MKKNNKGFMLVEVIVTSTVVVTTIVDVTINSISINPLLFFIILSPAF